MARTYTLAEQEALVDEQVREQGARYTAADLVKMYPDEVRRDLAAGRPYVTIGVPSGSEVSMHAELAGHLLRRVPRYY